MRRRAQFEGGFSTPIFVVFIGLLVLLLGRVVAEHRKVTGRVDGAAIAGATAVDEDRLYANPDLEPWLDEAAAVDRACDYLARNGVELACPGEVSIDVGTVDITVAFDRDVEVTLLRLLSLAGGSTDPISVGSTSTAVIQRGLP